MSNSSATFVSRKLRGVVTAVTQAIARDRSSAFSPVSVGLDIGCVAMIDMRAHGLPLAVHVLRGMAGISAMPPVPRISNHWVRMLPLATPLTPNWIAPSRQAIWFGQRDSIRDRALFSCAVSLPNLTLSGRSTPWLTRPICAMKA